MTRKFRGATYAIEISNPKHISKGVEKIIVNGETIYSNSIPLLEKNKTHVIRVIMG